MAAHARVWQHPRWSYDESTSPAARRAAARMAARSFAGGAAQAAPALAPGVERRRRPRPQAVPVPRLREVRRSRVRLLPALTLLILAGVVLMSPMVLNLASMRAEWRTAQLEQQRDDLVAQKAALQARVSALSSTQRVEETAGRLGMVKPQAVDFLAVSDAAAALGPWAGVERNAVQGASGRQEGGSADGQ